MIRFASLGSGSRGNALVVECGNTRILVDCGFPIREAAARLGRLGLLPAEVSAVVVTHEHGDHIGGAFRFCARYQVPLYLTHGTLSAIGRRADGLDIRVFDSHTRFNLGDVLVEPFPVPHDAREPVQFIFSDGAFRLGLLTDVGVPTAHIEQMLTLCDALVLECNHDLGMLEEGNYPPALKRRIASRFGHLDNQAAAALLARLDNSRLRHIVAAHLSEQNNTPELARTALASALGCERGWIAVAEQDRGLDWRSLD